MKKQLNLLPWRLTLHLQQSRRLLWKVIITISLASTLGFILNYFSQQASALLIEKQTTLQQINNQLIQTEQDIIKLRQSYIPLENYLPIPITKVENLLKILNILPLQQGELTELTFNKTQLVLKGIAENQTEFEQLNHFLASQHLFKQVTLSQFTPQINGSLQFQFILILEENK